MKMKDSFGALCAWIGVALACGWLALGRLPGQNAGAPDSDASPKALAVNRATEIPRLWQPHQHLYVKGDLRVARNLLDDLEQWLDANAPNWTVVLVESAAEEQFTTPQGQQFSGEEAVKHAVGLGLPNQTAFGQLVEPRTKEANGAIFILCLNERGLSYFGSDAQDKRRLGEDNWPGQLDRPAIAAMRSGGRIVDAVKDTVSSINRQLTDRITAEIEARARKAAAEAAARAQARETAVAALSNASARLGLLETKLAEFARAHPSLTGDLAQPDVSRLAAALRLAQEAFDRADFSRVGQFAKSVQEGAETILRAQAQYLDDRVNLEELKHSLESLESDRWAGFARGHLDTARAELGAAFREYERGDSRYLTHHESARQALNVARPVMASAAKAAMYRQRMTLMGGIAGLALLGVLGLLLNRRRSGAKREAETLAAAWQKGLEEKNDALVTLLEKSSSLIGLAADDARARFEGETLRLCLGIIKDVDESMIMAACAGRVLKDAQALLSPGGLAARLGNLVQKRRYERALKLLRDEPVVFRPEEGIEPILRGSRTERDRLLGDLKSYQPFTLSFNQLMEAFNERAGRALSALERVTACLSRSGSELAETQKIIDQARATEEPVARHAEADRLFQLAPVFAELLPAAQTALSEAMKQALNDPVGALQGPGAQARQQAGDALRLVNWTLETRSSFVPRIRERAGVLANQGFQVPWIETRLLGLSQQADQAGQAAVTAAATEQLESLQATREKLDLEVEQAVALDQQRRELAQPQISEAASAIATARQELGKALNLDPNKVLREAGADPSDCVKKAEEHIRGVFLTLDEGDVEAARSALEAVAQWTRQAQEIVADSRQAFADNTTLTKNLRAETERLAGLVADHRRILGEIRANYAPTVLLLGAGDATHPNANGTIEDNVKEVEGHLENAGQLMSQATAAFGSARLIESASRLDQLHAHLVLAVERLAELKEKEKRLAEATVANAAHLSQVEAMLRECEKQAAAHATMEPTRQSFAEATQLCARACEAVHTVPGDPFLAAASLQRAERALGEVADQARCDQDVFDEASRSFNAAASQLSKAQQLARESSTDEVADSQEIRQARAEVETLAAALSTLEAALRRPHEDWNQLDAEADRLAGHAAKLAAVLRGELEKAQIAIAALAAAAAEVRRAGGWTGGYGVAVAGAPGSDYLNQARSLLQHGRYEEASRQAAHARRQADAAIAAAEAEVRHRQRMEQERIERERRQRAAAEAARRSATQSMLSSSRSRSSSSSFSVGSGMRSSSFSSGSGFKSSRW